MLADDLRGAFLTSELTDEQLAELIAAGEERRFAPGDELFREGEPADYLWILLEGQHRAVAGAAANQTSPSDDDGDAGPVGRGLAGVGRRRRRAPATGRRATAVSDGRAFVVPSEDLGRLVGEWFPFGKHMITGVYQTIRSIDAMARQRESLVALGTLAAGLAHEINNPAAAALRAVEGLRRDL